MRSALSLLALAWLLPAAVFLCWAFRVVRQDYRDERAEHAAMREYQRRQDALRRVTDEVRENRHRQDARRATEVPARRNGRAS